MNAMVSLNEGDEIEGIEIIDDSDSDDEVSEIEMKTSSAAAHNR